MVAGAKRKKSKKKAVVEARKAARPKRAQKAPARKNTKAREKKAVKASRKKVSKRKALARTRKTSTPTFQPIAPSGPEAISSAAPVKL
jgi:hypothetical protein